MKKIILTILFMSLTTQIFSFSTEVSDEWKKDKKLQYRIENYLKERNGNYSFYIIDPKTHEYVSINDSDYIAASIIKTYLLVQVHKEIRDGNLSFDDELTLMDKYKVSGSGIIAKEPEGTKYTVRELLELVITISDNVAANILADHVGLENIWDTMEELELKGTNYGHLILPKEKTRYFYGWNRTSTKDLANTYYKIYQRTCLGEEYDTMLMELFTKCKSNYKIPKLLPDGTKVSHKTGSLPLYEHDAGIVFTENRDYIIACMSNELKSNGDGQRTIATVSRIVYNHMMEKDKMERTGQLNSIESKLVLNDNEFDIYDFQEKLVVSVDDILRGNLVLDENGDIPELYGGNLENLCENNFDILYSKESDSFDLKDALLQRDRIKIGSRISNIVISENKNFIFIEDLKEIGRISFYEDNNYHMKIYAGDVLKPSKPVFILNEEVIAYDVDGKIYVPLGYYYSRKNGKGSELIKRYTDYLIAKGVNYEISKAEYVNLNYDNDIEKFDILSIDGEFVINIDEINVVVEVN